MEIVQLETASRDLEGLLGALSLGQTITLADDTGKPVALLVSLQAEPRASSQTTDSLAEWRKQWDALAEEIGKSWKGEKSAIEELTEIRR